uniref:ERCC excision repair 1, endonuclease non-catalytic subunit n=1 Tax=Anas zonorhyncha TaxID=75864 RepID=A0A8B9VHH5_9AVES
PRVPSGVRHGAARSGRGLPEAPPPFITESGGPRRLERPRVRDFPLPVAIFRFLRGNPVLRFVRGVPWEFGDIVPDYVLGPSTCALFLSLRYHNLNPDYIHERLRSLGRSYALQLLLLQVDVKDPHQAVKELAKICVLADCTLILAWSPEEAGRYLETYKAYEQKPPDLLRERVEPGYMARVSDCLTSVKSVNRTDALSLLSTFGSLAAVARAPREELALCPGIGPQKDGERAAERRAGPAGSHLPIVGHAAHGPEASGAGHGGGQGGRALPAARVPLDRRP